MDRRKLHGRGAAENPANRFELIEYVPAQEETGPDIPAPATQFFRDSSRTILTHNESPDVGFEVSINPYRGCEHGCIYCYARPFHEYLGFSSGLDFETKIMVKEDAPELLRRALLSPRYEPRVIAISGVTDAYQPAERRFEITRRCLEVLLEFRNPVAIVTKNYLVTRDLDLLSELARWQAAQVNVSITSLDANLQRVMEPRTSTPARRLAAIEALSRAGVPVRVMVAPVIPGLTDHEMPRIVKAAAEAGARAAAYIAVRLPYAVKDLFENWLERHFPDRREKVLNRIREIRGGKLYDSQFHARMRGEGIYAEQLESLFKTACRKAGIDHSRLELSTAAFQRPTSGQLRLFDSAKGES